MTTNVMHLKDVSAKINPKLDTVLVTGGAGFIGSNFIRLLLNCEKYNVVNLDALYYAGNKETLVDILNHENHIFIQGDISDRDLISNLFEHYKFSAIFNFAAESHVDRSIQNADPFIQSNIIGTYELLQVSNKYFASLSDEHKSKFRFLQISTDEVYGDLDETGYFSETSNYNPSSPYSASKAAADHLVHAYHRTYGLPTLITNCSNNYGPYQYPEKLIPVVISNAISGNKIPIYGDGENIRDWLFVEDHCDAILTVFNNGKVGEKYCIGGESEKTNIEIANEICSVLDELCPLNSGYKYSGQIQYVEDRAGHDRRYAIDFAKIRDDLGWNPKQNFNSGMKKTINWYLNNQDWCKAVTNYNNTITALKDSA